MPRLVGVDGQAKMSKSLDNAIYLSDDSKTVENKIKRMITDVTGKNPRLKATDPGVVEYNPVFLYHDAFNPDTQEVDDLKDRYGKGTVSDAEVKQTLVKALNDLLDPIRERRAHYEANVGEVYEAIDSGTKRAKVIAQQTMQEVREAMQVIYT